MIVLDEPLADSQLGENFFVVAFEKKSAIVFEDFGGENQRVGQRTFNDLHAASSEYALFQNLQQISPVTIIFHRLCGVLYLLCRDVSQTVSNLLRARDHQA